MRVEYVNVTRDKDGLERMLRHSKGRRDVPVIVEDDKVVVGYGGGS